MFYLIRLLRIRSGYILNILVSNLFLPNMKVDQRRSLLWIKSYEFWYPQSHLKYKCEIFNYATKESLIYLNLVFEYTWRGLCPRTRERAAFNGLNQWHQITCDVYFIKWTTYCEPPVQWAKKATKTQSEVTLEPYIISFY